MWSFIRHNFKYAVGIMMLTGEAMAQVPVSPPAVAPGVAVPVPAVPAATGRTTFGPGAPTTVVPVPATTDVTTPAAVVVPAATVAATPPASVVGSETAIAGHVVRTKQVDLRGTAEKNLVALVDMGNGREQIVELGSSTAFKAAPVYTGDAIAVRGAHANIGQLDVFVASSATIGNTNILVHRETAAPAVAVVTKAGYPVTEQMVKVQGRVNRLRKAKLAGSQMEHVVVELVTRGGQAIVTDLGPPEQIWRADVKQGEWITVRGQEMKIDNRPVLLALEINKSGVPVLVDRHLVRGEPTASVVEPAPVIETAAVIPRPAVVTPPTTLVPGTTVEQGTPAEVVPPRVSPPPVVP